MKTKLLSICIPTYNRCEILDESLKNIFSNPEFDSSRVEVIVSDNCSTDATKEVVAKYPLVGYYCNDKNLGFLNLTVSLSYAKGKYIKIFNDTLSFKPGRLADMLDRIENHLNKNENVFFYANMFNNANNIIEINTIDEYFKEVSFYSTWSANFGLWFDDFQKIRRTHDEYISLLFPHLNLNYKIIKNGKKSVIYFDDLFEVSVPKMKGGHNVFETIVNEYLFIVKKEKLQQFFTYEIEKYRVCRYLIYPTLISLMIKDKKNYSYDTNGAFLVIFNKYWYEPYLYPMLLIFFLKKISNFKINFFKS